MKGTHSSHAAPAARPSHPAADRLTVRDIMSTGVLVLDPDVTLRDAVELLSNRHITGAPVVATGKLVGVISANDILAFEAETPGVPTEQPEQAEEDGVETPEEQEWAQELEAPGTYFNDAWSDAGADVGERFQELKGPEWDMLNEHTVEEAMSRGVRSVAPDCGVTEAAAYMLKERVHRAIVLDDGELVGIVTATDIMRAVAERRI